jgi:hypothetical protein
MDAPVVLPLEAGPAEVWDGSRVTAERLDAGPVAGVSRGWASVSVKPKP